MWNSVEQVNTAENITDCIWCFAVVMWMTTFQGMPVIMGSHAGCFTEQQSSRSLHRINSTRLEAYRN